LAVVEPDHNANKLRGREVMASYLTQFKDNRSNIDLSEELDDADPNVIKKLATGSNNNCHPWL
jgi:hypothetical protein